MGSVDWPGFSKWLTGFEPEVSPSLENVNLLFASFQKRKWKVNTTWGVTDWFSDSFFSDYWCSQKSGLWLSDRDFGWNETPFWLPPFLMFGCSSLPMMSGRVDVTLLMAKTPTPRMPHRFCHKFILSLHFFLLSYNLDFKFDICRVSVWFTLPTKTKKRENENAPIAEKAGENGKKADQISEQRKKIQ